MFRRVHAIIPLRLVHDQKRWSYSIVIVNNQLVVIQTSPFLGQNLFFKKYTHEVDEKVDHHLK